MAELNSSADRSGRKSSLRKLSPRVDLTAMVDLAFLLITFFIMTTTLNKQKIMPVAMPDKEGPASMSVPASRTLTVCLGKDNKVMWYLGLPGEPILKPHVSGYGETGLRKALVDAKAYVKKTTGKPMLVIIKPADSSVYENLVTTLDEMAITGVASYAIVDISVDDIGLLKKNGIY